MAETDLLTPPLLQNRIFPPTNYKRKVRLMSAVTLPPETRSLTIKQTVRYNKTKAARGRGIENVVLYL